MTFLEHKADLVERHVILHTLDSKTPLPTGELLVRMRQRTWSFCATEAEKWANDEGVVVDVEPFENQHPDGRPMAWGVRFTLTVGVGQESTEPDVPLPWTWSSRWRSWGETFRLLARPDLQLVTDGEVVPLRR